MARSRNAARLDVLEARAGVGRQRRPVPVYQPTACPHEAARQYRSILDGGIQASRLRPVGPSEAERVYREVMG